MPANAVPASHHTDPGTNGSQRPAEPVASRRQVLAFLALADAPAPSWIRFQSDGVLSIDVDSMAAATAWRAELGDCGWWSGETHLMDDIPGRAPYFVANSYGDWRGWHIRLNASDPASAGVELDADTREQLAEVAAGGTR
jgi:hypothetical protein